MLDHYKFVKQTDFHGLGNNGKFASVIFSPFPFIKYSGWNYYHFVVLL